MGRDGSKTGPQESHSVLVLPEDVLRRVCQPCYSPTLMALACTCKVCCLVVLHVAEMLLAELHDFQGQHTELLVPRLRQLHLLERMSSLHSSSMGMHHLQGNKRHREGVILHAGMQLSSGAPVRSVACGHQHAVLLDSRGLTWALGEARASGVSSLDFLSEPTFLVTLKSVSMKKVACGNRHTVAMSTDGNVYSWGRDVVSPLLAWQLPDPRRSLALEAVDVAAGDSHISVVTLTGDVHVWGHNHHGQCARAPDSRPCVSSARSPASTGLVARRTACGRYHTVVLTVEGAVYTFGASMSGQLGRHTGDSAPSWQAGRVEPPSSRFLVIQVCCGDEHTLCLSDVGRIYAFGSSERGQLCLGGVKTHRLPVMVRTLGNICEIASGGEWSLVRDRDNRVFLAGSNEEDVDDFRLLQQVA